MNARPAIAAVLFAVVSFGQTNGRAAPQLPTAQLRLDKLKQMPVVVLKGREADGRLVCQMTQPPGSTMRLKPADISRIRFRLRYDQKLVAKLRRAGRWTDAATVMGAAVIPVLPYLDAAPNNATGLAMRMGNYLLRGGDLRTGFATDPASRAAGEREFQYALTVFQKVAAAEWSDRAPEAQMRACMCLVFLGRTEEAEAVFDAIAEPEAEADEYGVYQLARAYCAAAKGEWHEAIEAAVHSSDFASKDIETFPSALLLAAQCYEKLDEWHRARDVYYELGRLFAQTPWGVVARQDLKRILDEGKTNAEESAGADDVFFGADEDINAESRKLLGIDENGNPIAKPEPADQK